ncbi:MAG TPA: hypothetical protein VN688_01595 [Gemmataceae bacterium]|nr:hypothetical protein [Gemmataceae bacterium]
MTEAEWTACTDPTPMLAFLRDQMKSRKMRLFACSCCRHIWHRLIDERSRNAVEAAERYAERLITHVDLKRAWGEASEAFQGSLVTHYGQSKAALAAKHAADPSCSSLVEAVSYAARVGYSQKEFDAEKAIQATLLQDLVGNPFRPVSVASSWLAWNEGTVVKLAKAIYEDRAFDRLPILADALEEAGCQDQDILDHCRQPGEHVRGCWVIDLLLGKA